MKIFQKTSATRSPVIVPDSGTVWFSNTFNYYVSTVDQAANEELHLGTSVATSCNSLGFWLEVPSIFSFFFSYLNWITFSNLVVLL